MQGRIKRDGRLRGIAFEHRIELSIGPDDVHFYSPQLVVRVAALGDEGSELQAQFGPDPYIWAFYVMGSGLLGLVTLLAGIFGVVQLMLHQSPVALYVAPAAGGVAALVYGASFVGQGLGYPQMHFLRHVLEECADAPIDEPGSAIAPVSASIG